MTDGFGSQPLRDTSDLLKRYETAIDYDYRPRRWVWRTALSIALLLLLVFFGPLALKKGVLWAVSDLDLTGNPGVAGAAGPAGEVGADGVAGANGVNGLPGARGKTGATGADGAAGANGADGAAGINGIDGLDGAPGAPGVAGPAGPVGPPGPAGGTTPISIGQGSGQTAACDSNIGISLRSRWDGSRLVLGSITLRNVSDDCAGQRLAVFVIDYKDELLSSIVANNVMVSDGQIVLSHHDYADFDSIPSSQVHQIIVEMAG